MSVLIKIPMPENCAECPCLRHDSIDGVNAYQCNITFGIRKNIDRKPKWCPLVDLGKHGQLIDVDAFKAGYGMKDNCADCEKEMHGKAKACDYYHIYSKMDFCNWLDDADVVIEAEDNE